MNQRQIKEAAVAKLAQDGIEISADRRIGEITAAVEKHTGLRKRHREDHSAYLIEYAFPKTPPREPQVFRPMDPDKHRHWRLEDIDRGQPPMMTPNYSGVGCSGRSISGRESSR